MDINNISLAGTYFSQFGEDKILASIFKGKTTGFCIEVGANDGIHGSTTFYFERAGWDCLLIEPNPTLCEQIRAIRTASVVECAASSQRGRVELLVATGAPLAHGVSTIEAGEGAIKKIQSYGFSYKKIMVESLPLDEILSVYATGREIDFVSVDVEGHELEVLKGFDLDRWQPTILLLEDNFNGTDTTVRDYLARCGYYPFRRTGVNDWYAKQGGKYKLITLQNRVPYFLGMWLKKQRERLKKKTTIRALWKAWKKILGAKK
ncbi:MAG: FkbM family methyltransferase [Methylobacillus sp.]|jgi:FkbM family methyltransferase|nr:FkbM family methyltransferase [Methylobacillus sp.]